MVRIREKTGRRKATESLFKIYVPSSLTTRKPVSSLRRDGKSLQRFAERISLAGKLQAPPRMTRLPYPHLDDRRAVHRRVSKAVLPTVREPFKYIAGGIDFGVRIMVDIEHIDVFKIHRFFNQPILAPVR